MISGYIVFGKEDIRTLLYIIQIIWIPSSNINLNVIIIRKAHYDAKRISTWLPKLFGTAFRSHRPARPSFRNRNRPLRHWTIAVLRDRLPLPPLPSGMNYCASFVRQKTSPRIKQRNISSNYCNCYHTIHCIPHCCYFIKN